MKKTALSASLFLIASLATLGTAQAQWSVIDVNSNAIKQTLDNIKEGVKGTMNELQGVRKNQEVQVKQVDQYQEDTDKRNRLAYGMQESIRRDLDAIPTLQQCAEMTNRAGNSSGYQASISGSGGGRGSRANANTFSGATKAITSTATAQANVLMQVKNAQTCGGGMDDAINGCSGEQDYAGADVNSGSLKKNFASKNSVGIMTNTLNNDGYNAALTYAKNATLYAAPPELTVNEVRKNPAYLAVYKPVIAKLNASYEALTEIATLRRAPGAMPSGFAGQKWDDEKANYQATFGVVAPAIPSFYEALNFAVMRDYAGPKKADESSDPVELARQLNEKMVINNVIAMQQYRAAENTNILLAHLLTQSVTPTNVENVRAEAAKTRNTN